VIFLSSAHLIVENYAFKRLCSFEVPLPNGQDIEFEELYLHPERGLLVARQAKNYGPRKVCAWTFT
jgi:hypothetical protein